MNQALRKLTLKQRVVSGLQNQSITKPKLHIRHCECLLHRSDGDASRYPHKAIFPLYLSHEPSQRSFYFFIFLNLHLFHDYYLTRSSMKTMLTSGLLYILYTLVHTYLMHLFDFSPWTWMFVIGSPFVNPQLHSVCILGSTLHSTPDCIVYSLWEYY